MEGFETYRAFAPEGWTPPSAADETAPPAGHARPRTDVWYRVAEHDGELVGHVGFLPAEHTFAPTGDPGLAHFRQLFVARAHWGSGLAARLHAAALAEARARGFTAHAPVHAGGAGARAALLRARGLGAGAPASVRASASASTIAEYRRAL